MPQRLAGGEVNPHPWSFLHRGIGEKGERIARSDLIQGRGALPEHRSMHRGTKTGRLTGGEGGEGKKVVGFGRRRHRSPGGVEAKDGSG